MGKNTKKIIITAIVIAIIAIMIITGGLLYLLTDLFKSDQQLFYKYMAQNKEMYLKLIEDKNKESLESLKQNKYSIDGNISFNLVSNDNEIANQTIPARNFNIEYKTQVDSQAKKDSTQTTIKFLNKELFEVKYAHDNDLYGITSNEVINKYLTFNNNNLKELATKYGITDLDNIPDKIEIQDYVEIFKSAVQENQYILEEYWDTIYKQISKDKYYHNKNIIMDIEDSQVKGNLYGLNLDAETIKNVFTEILTKLQQDEQILNVILQAIENINDETEVTLKDLKDTISNYISEIEENEEIQNIKIEVFESQGKIMKVLVKLENGEVLTCTYQTNENSIRALVSFEYNDIGSTNDIMQGISLKIKSVELAKKTEIGKNNQIIIITLDAGNDTEYKISIQNKMEQSDLDEFNNNVVINISNSKTYFTVDINSITKQSDDIIVEELTDANSAVLNKFSKEYMTSLIQAIGNRLQTLLNQKMLLITTTQQNEVEQLTTDKSTTIPNTLTNT